MGLSSGQRRNNRPVRAAWYQAYRERIARGLEVCRACDADGSDWRGILTFDHLVPNSAGHALSFANATILCRRCQVKKGKSLWPWLQSLLMEECAGPPGRRLGLIATVEFSQHRMETMVKMSREGRDALADLALSVIVAAWPCALTAEEIAEAVPGQSVALVAKAAKAMRRAGLVVNTSQDVPVPVPATWAATELSRAGQTLSGLRVAEVAKHAEIIRVLTGEAPIDPAWLAEQGMMRTGANFLGLANEGH